MQTLKEWYGHFEDMYLNSPHRSPEEFFKQYPMPKASLEEIYTLINEMEKEDVNKLITVYTKRECDNCGQFDPGGCCYGVQGEHTAPYYTEDISLLLKIAKEIGQVSFTFTYDEEGKESLRYDLIDGVGDLYGRAAPSYYTSSETLARGLVGVMIEKNIFKDV